MDFFSARPTADADHRARVREWAVELFGKGAAPTVLVTELRCTEPGCPPVETVIAVMHDDTAPEQYKVHKPMGEIERGDLVGLAPQPSANQSPSKGA